MKEKDLDKDTIVAYHAYLQQRIHNELNATGLGPAQFPCRLAQFLFGFSFSCCVTGILIITLRHRHVYLVDWWSAFLGPAFIIGALALASGGTYAVIAAKRRANAYRRELFFRPIGDYGVGVVHKSTIIHEEEHKSDLKTGSAPNRDVKPRSEAYGEKRHHRERYARDNHGYNDNGHDSHHDRDRDRDRDRHRRRPDDRDRDRRRDEDRDRRRHDDDRRRHDDDRRRHDDDRRRRDDDRRPDDRDRKRHPDDRRDERRRGPRIPRDEKAELRGEPEKRRPPPDERDGEQEKRRPDDLERPSGESRGGRRAVRGLPKIAVTETAQPAMSLDPDFGKPAGFDQGESEL